MRKELDEGRPINYGGEHALSVIKRLNRFINRANHLLWYFVKTAIIKTFINFKIMKYFLSVLLVILIIVAPSVFAASKVARLKITSSAFKHNQPIPVKYAMVPDV